MSKHFAFLSSMVALAGALAGATAMMNHGDADKQALSILSPDEATPTLVRFNYDWNIATSPSRCGDEHRQFKALLRSASEEHGTTSTEACASLKQCQGRWAMAELQRSSKVLAASLRTGDAELRDVIELAATLVDNIDEDSQKVCRDGSVTYDILVPEELGTASITLPAPDAATDQRLEIIVNSPESMHDVLNSEYTKGSRIEIRLGFGVDRGIDHCSAFAYSEPVPSHNIYRDHLGSGWITVGASLSADRDECAWTPIKMLLLDEDGEFQMRQEVADPTKRDDHLADQPGLDTFGDNLLALIDQ